MTNLASIEQAVPIHCSHPCHDQVEDTDSDKHERQDVSSENCTSSLRHAMDPSISFGLSGFKSIKTDTSLHPAICRPRIPSSNMAC